jgi:hypothetical protein
MEYEQLLRGVLALPNKPAVLNLQTIGLVFDALSQGGDQVSGLSPLVCGSSDSFRMKQQLGVSQYYDVPVITIRSLILPIIFNDYRDAERFFTRKPEVSDDASWEEQVDLRHVSPLRI